MQKLFIFLLTLPLFADEPICVRNYGEDTCKQFPSAYALVKPLNEDLDEGGICARVYLEFYCSYVNKEYSEVLTLEGKKICVLNTNQPPVANLCESTPQFYAYIRAK